MKTKVDISLCGNEEDIAQILKVLSVIRHYCVKGCSRTIKIHIDGDGSADLYATLGKGVIGEYFHSKFGDQVIDCCHPPKNKLGDIDDFEVYIGE